jgi:hypothetical protein
MSEEVLTLNPTVRVSLDLTVRVRGRGLQSVRFGPETDPALRQALLDLLSDPGGETRAVRLNRAQAEILRQAGLLVPDEEAPRDICYRCPLEGARPALLPGSAAKEFAAPPSQASYALSPFVWLQSGPVLPQPLCGRVTSMERFAAERPLLWVDDPGTGVLMPYWPGPACLPLLRSLLEPGAALPPLPADLLTACAWATVLVPHGWSQRRRACWQDTCAAAKDHLATHGYAVLREVVNPLQLAALRGYFRELEGEGYFQNGDKQVARRNIIHNEPTARFLHHQLAALINRVTPEPVKPSYCYLSVYKSGAALKRHIDRPQCAWNVSLALDMDPEMDRTEAWPIYLEVGGRARDVRLGLGDAVIYRGTTIPHWRDELPQGQTATVCFYHFVPEEFTGKLD